MKILATILLGLCGLALVIGGLGSAAEQTYPAQVPVQAAVNVGATPGDPSMLLILVVVAIVGLVFGLKSGR